MKTHVKRLIAALAALLPLAQPLLAQSVSISPRTGGLLMAETENGEQGAASGMSAMWLHNQIGLTLQVSDFPTLTEGGGLKVPAGNISLYSTDDQDEGRYVLIGGYGFDHYLALSLPEGFRFTGYELVVKNNLNGKTINGVSFGSISKTLYETDKTFSIDDANKYYNKTAAMSGTNSEEEVRLSRESSDRGADMGNHLYFRINRGEDKYFALTIVSFVVRFTTEGGVDVTVAPSHVKNTASTHGLATFAVGKTDVGPLTPYRDKQGGVHYAYNYANYKSLRADNIIYSATAVGADDKVDLTDQTGNKTITAVYNSGSLHWGLGNDTYYVETPVEAHSLSGTHHAVTYRITGARVNYKYGQPMAGTTDPDHGPITYTEADGSTLYLNSQGFFTNVEDEAHVWRKDTGDDELTRIRDERGHYMLVHEVKEDAGHIRRSLYVSAVPAKDLKGRSEGSETLEWYKDVYVDAAGAVYYDVQTTEEVTGDDGETKTETITTRYYLTGSSGGTSPGFSADTDEATVALRASHSGTTVGAFTPQPYTLTVYDKTGQTAVGTVQVGAGNQSGYVTLTGLNNDAIKFQVSDLPQGGQALVTVTLTIEALNPYISRLRMVCEDPVDHRQMAQTFTVDEFDVRGGKFVFYVPQDFVRTEGTLLNFSFDRLYHRYADNTYGDAAATGKARHSFVGSEYYGTAAANVENLYDKDPDAPYTDKVSTLYCGSDPFEFNNVDELGIATEEDQTKYLEEYRFSLADYNGTFARLQKSCSSGTDVRYLFTSDETRYNIAPTRATQHRARAAYRLEFELETRDYTPKATWTKVYDQTCHGDADGQDVTRPQWGLTLETTVPEGEAQGYLTTDQIVDILRDMPSGTGDAQATTADILYVDASRLSTIAYQKADDGAISAPGLIRRLLGANALVYLPRLMTVDDDNFAYLTEQGSFRASNNIVLTDGKPFYAPHDIQVGAYRRATYRRTLRWATDGQRTNCTLLLPFTLSVDQEGLHTETGGGGSFRLRTMQATNCLGAATEAETDRGAVDNYFGSLAASSLAAQAEANTPYMVEVVSHPTDQGADFVATQQGAIVRATTAMDADDYTFRGETGQGTTGGTSHAFTHYGSYSGQKIDKTLSYFYFASNMLLNSQNLSAAKPYVYVYPFRSYYECTTGAGPVQLPRMRIAYGENPSAPGTTGISETRDEADLLVTSGHGRLTLTATRAQTVEICTPGGVAVARPALRAGETRSLPLPAGLYLVGKTKITVR